MKRLYALLMPICVLCTQAADAAVLLSYNINGLTAGATQQSPTTATNVDATIIGEPETFANAFLSAFGESVSRSAPAYAVGWDQPNALGAVNWTNNTAPNNDEFFAFALRAQDGYQLDITDASFNWGSTNNGPSKIRVTIDIGNGTTTETLIGDYDVTRSGGADPTATLISDTIDMAPTSDVIIFRVYGYSGAENPANGNNQGGFWDPTGSNPIELNGTVTAVPEPSIAILGLLGALLCLLRRHRV